MQSGLCSNLFKSWLVLSSQVALSLNHPIQQEETRTMLTQIPAFAKAYLDEYLATGTVPYLTERIEFDAKEVDRQTKNISDSFARWRALDESDADLYKPLPNEVYLKTKYGYQQASLQGDVKAGRVVSVQAEPDAHFGFESATIKSHSPTALESILVTHSVEDSSLDSCILAHVDPQTHTGYQLYMNR